MQLQLKTWQFVEDYLKTKTGIIIPIGSTEQHGPTGLIGTDALTAEMIGRGVGEKVGALVAPTISVGMAQHHLDFPGSMTLAADDPDRGGARHGDVAGAARLHALLLRQRPWRQHRHGDGGVLRDLCRALDGAHEQPALDQVRAAQLVGRAGHPALQKELYPSGEGSHATASEVALTWYKYPETMQRKPMEPRIAPNGSFADAEDYRRAFPDGRIGSDPNQATPEHGKRFYDTAVEDVARDYEKWVAR